MQFTAKCALGARRSSSMSAPIQPWDIFCAVVDNFGDAGVAWRLARQLASEHSLAVRLFIDGLPALARLAPDVDTTLDAQCVDNVEVRKWGGTPAGVRPPRPGAGGVQAVGCGPPPSVLPAMGARAARPVWVQR